MIKGRVPGGHAAFKALCAVSLALACAGCGGIFSGALSASPATLRRMTTPAGAGSATAQSCVQRVLSGMTQAQRVGQLFLVGIAADSTRAVIAPAERSYHFGSLLFGDDSAGVAGIGQATSAIQALATRRDTAGVRFFIAANQEGGEVQDLSGPGFATIPSAVDQGQLPAQELRQQARGWGRELREAGVNLNLAPVMDVVPAATESQNQPIGALDREYGNDPSAVSGHGTAFIKGMASEGVATTAKHFPGLGRVMGNTDFTSDVVDDVTTSHDPYLQTYRSAIKAGVPFVMIALATYTRIDPGRLAVFSQRVIRQMLRGTMRFTGVVISDDLGGAAAVASVPAATRAIDFLGAGGDMITSQTLDPAIEMATALVRRSASDPALRSEINAAVLRILTAKKEFGLLSCR